MPEDGLETHDFCVTLEEATERARGCGHDEAPPWTVQLSLSTALCAVFAAIAALEAGAHANDAIIEKNDAVLHQSKAADAWALYQAKGVKLGIYAAQADVIDATNAVAAERFREKAKRYEEEQRAIEKAAREEEAKVEENNRASAHSLHVHHEFARSVTFFQVAIALSAIAALTRRRLMWFVGLAAGLGGLFLFLRGFGLSGH